MNLPASESAEPESSGFPQLDERIQRWIWAEGWTALRDVQEAAIPALIHADRDVIIAAATASGKTEAAFFPILTNLAREPEMGCVIYISPLKALINDQWGRLENLCESLEIPVIPWHGDIGVTKKSAFLKKPKGVLLITPESLEAMFVNRGSSLSFLFKALRYIVIDEIHAFIGSERGKQLQSLLHRLDVVMGRSAPRVGLSATLGDMGLAAEFMRPENAKAIQPIVSKNTEQELHLLLKGYVEKPPKSPQEKTKDNEDKIDNPPTTVAIAENLYRVLHGTNNLVFPNSRAKVEVYADLLRRRCEDEHIPNEFWPHHGSLSKELREETEHALKAGDRPATAICTSTLELGIDIGAVKSIAQIGSPPSVASMRQRLGRSGRRAGESAILRCFCVEHELTDKSPLSDRLHEGLIQSIAMVQLLIVGWCEPPQPQGLHASTLVQQFLSLIAQYGGITIPKAWDILVKGNVFPNLNQQEFVSLLKTLAEHDLIHQDNTGLVLLGERGEKFVNHYDFYAAFVSEEEFRIVHNGNTLGSLPISHPVMAQQHIIFAGRRWQVVDVDTVDKVIIVTPSPGGIPPQFDGGGNMVHGRIRQEMKAVFESDSSPAFLDSTAKALLAEARANYRMASLEKTTFLKEGANLLLMNWRGDSINSALAMFLTALGFPTTNEGIFVRFQVDNKAALVPILQKIAEASYPELMGYLEKAKNLENEKWDWALPKELLVKSFASTKLDCTGTQVEAKRLWELCQE